MCRVLCCYWPQGWAFRGIQRRVSSMCFVFFSLSDTYISVMFSMSSNVRNGKSSMPGTESIQAIREMLQEHDAGHPSPDLHRPRSRRKNPRRAIPHFPASVSIAGPNDKPTRYPQTECAGIELLRDFFFFPHQKKHFFNRGWLKKKKNRQSHRADHCLLIWRCHGMALL